MGSMDKTILSKIITRPDPWIIEAGGHYGEDTKEFCFLYPKGRIHVFEPDLRCIRKIHEISGCRFTLVEGALSDVDGSIVFHPCGEGYDGSGSILIPTKHLDLWPNMTLIEPYEVLSVTLDTYARMYEIDYIDFMWADVQGAEEKIIKGGADSFRNKVRYLYTEYCQTELYAGCPKKERILELLPHFTVLSDIGSEVCGDMLLRNEELV